MHVILGAYPNRVSQGYLLVWLAKPFTTIESTHLHLSLLQQQHTAIIMIVIALALSNAEYAPLANRKLGLSMSVQCVQLNPSILRKNQSLLSLGWEPTNNPKGLTGQLHRDRDPITSPSPACQQDPR